MPGFKSLLGDVISSATSSLRNQQQSSQSSSSNKMNHGNGYSGGQGYPPPGQDHGYSSYAPQGQPGSGYSGYSPQQGQTGHGYPPQGQPGAGYPGYPPQGQSGAGYPPPGQSGAGYPGYPPQSGPGYPTGDIGFAFPGQSGGASGGYPPQAGFGPSQEMGRPQHGSYPSGQSHAPYQPNTGGVVHQPHTFHTEQSRAPGASSMSYGRPSVHPEPNFNANADAETLRKAMKGFGCNNSKVIAVLCARSNVQRQEIARAFKVMYGKDLLGDLKSELHGDFEDLILALMQLPAHYDAAQLRKAMEGLGTKESVLIEIMCSRTNAQIAELRMAYRQMYGKDLESELIGETSGCFKRLLVSLCAGGRDESFNIDPMRANQDARKLYSAGERRLGTDESCFNAILASQNYAQLRMVFDEYEKVTHHPIEKAIEGEFSGDIRDGLLAVIKCVRNRPAYFAQCLYDSMKGLGTRDNDLIRVVATRAEVDMADIRDAFQHMYKTSLEATIKGDCSGSYKEGLIALVRGN